MKQSFHIPDAGDAPHGRNQLFELLLILHIDSHLDERVPCRIEFSLGFQTPNIRALIGKNRRDLVQQAGAIVCMNYQFYRERGRRRAFPGHIDLALRLIEQVLHIGAELGVYGHAFAAGHVAHDGLSANRIAALGAINHQIVHPAHLDHAVAFAVRPGW